ncbi:hypothetical protein Bca4012_002186 [Brassica carinata]
MRMRLPYPFQKCQWDPRYGAHMPFIFKLPPSDESHMLLGSIISKLIFQIFNFL